MSKILLEADLAQEEIRVAAHCSRCRGLIDLFNRDGDPHTETAIRIFGLSFDVASREEYRYPTKRMNFGVIYGITAEGLAADIEEHVADIVEEGGVADVVAWSVEDCGRLIDEWHKLYPEVKDFRMEQVAHARRYGYVKDMFGRIRFVPEIYCPIRSIQEAGARQAGNMPIQCLPASTRIRTKLGYERIGDFAGGDVWTGAEWASAVRIDKGIGDLVQVNVSDGTEFICDIAHHLLVGRSVWPDWVNVMDLKEGDPLVSSIPDLSPDNGLQLEDTGFWYWVGRYYGDGHFTDKTYNGRRKRNIAWAFGGVKTPEADVAVQYLKSHGYSSSLSSSKRLSKDGKRTHSCLRLSSASKLCNKFESYGVIPNEVASNKRVADVVFKLDNSRKQAFLDGYYDADGTRRRKRITEWSPVSITSISKGLLMDVILLLRSLGKRAYLNGPYDYASTTGSYKNHSPFWKLRLHSGDADWWGSPVQDTRWQRQTSSKSNEKLVVSVVPLHKSEPVFTLSVNSERHSFDSEGLISRNSGSQGIVKLGMAKLFRERNEFGWQERVKFLLQIHDSLIVECDDDEEFVKEVATWLVNGMTQVVKLLVPLKADVKWGRRWGSMEKMEL